MTTTTQTSTVTIEVPTETPTPSVLVKPQRVNFMKENGEVNLEALTPEQVKKCEEITKHLDSNVVGSVSNFGADLQATLAKSSKAFLDKASVSRSGEIGQLINELSSQLDLVDVKNLKADNALVKVLRNVPIVNKFIPSIQKVLRKYHTIEQELIRIQDCIAATRLVAISDNNSLQAMFEDIITYVKQLEAVIVAGTLATQKAQNELVEMTQVEGEYDIIAIQDKKAFIAQLEKKVSDLQKIRVVAKQELMQIRLVQRNNILLADNAQSMISMAMPVFQQQLAIAAALKSQKDGEAVFDAVGSKLNEAIVRNAENLHQNSVAIANDANKSIISNESIKKASDEMLATIKEIRQVQEDASEKRRIEAIELAKIESETQAISAAITSGNQDHTPKGITLD